jgi:hypothetical protein
LATVRRPVDEVVASALATGVPFDKDRLVASMRALDRKLDQMEKRLPGVLSVHYDDLQREDVCAELFTHCTGLPHDHDWWAKVSAINIQSDFPRTVRYAQAYLPAMDKIGKMLRQQTVQDLHLTAPRSLEGIVFKEVGFDEGRIAAEKLINEHLLAIGDAPGSFDNRNLDVFRLHEKLGRLQVLTAQCNGRIFGYLMSIIGADLTKEGQTSAYHTGFYASPSFPGMGLKLQREAAARLKAKGVGELIVRAGVVGSGPKMDVIYRRMGAEDMGEIYRIDLKE